MPIHLSVESGSRWDRPRHASEIRAHDDEDTSGHSMTWINGQTGQLIQHQSHADFGWFYYGLLMFKENPPPKVFPWRSDAFVELPPASAVILQLSRR